MRLSYFPAVLGIGADGGRQGRNARLSLSTNTVMADNIKNIPTQKRQS
jgi:hypothetical protein